MAQRKKWDINFLTVTYLPLEADPVDFSFEHGRNPRLPSDMKISPNPLNQYIQERHQFCCWW